MSNGEKRRGALDRPPHKNSAVALMCPVGNDGSVPSL